MKKVFSNIFNRTRSKTSDSSIDSDAVIQRKNLNNHQSLGSHNGQEKRLSIIIDVTISTFSQPSTSQYERAILVESSSITFGNECLRFVNIAFQTSQTFQSIMDTCNNISQYLRKELFKKYSREYFYIIIGQNNVFGFAIDDGDYFAEMEQDQYRVIIFTTRLNRNVNLATHDANSQIMLEWKHDVGKQSKK